MQVNTTGQMAEFNWSDTEDAIRGHWRPVIPSAGGTLRVAIRVGTFEGKAFAGPVTITLRPAAEGHGETVTVQPSPGWNADFHPEEAGTYQLDVAFRTTHF